MSKEFAVVISPHIDDAVISLGEVLKGYDKVLVLNVFNQSTETITDVPQDSVNSHRISEDKIISENYGFEFKYANLPDTSLRNVDWDDCKAPVDHDLLSEAQDWIKLQLDELDGDFKIFIPAAYGLHPDHYLATLTFSTEPLFYYLKWIPFSVYCEQPYYGNRKLSGCEHEGHKYLDETGKLIAVPFPLEEKQKMLRAYKSQLSDERITFLTHKNKAEYYWQIDTNFFVKSLIRRSHG